MKKVLSLIILISLISSCAIKMNPTGGIKDIEPPKILNSAPSNFTTNFKEKKIVLSFDEFVQLSDLQNQLLISPLMEPKPEITVAKKNITIKLSDSLKANTTYTFNFGKAIVDVHESNPLDGYQFVFSTGPILDSLSFSGKVNFASNNENANAIAVMLYLKSDTLVTDSLVFKRRPDYVCKSTTDGAFRISNVTEGKYTAIALEDKNGNYKCDDSQDEKLGFLNSIVYLPKDSIINFKVAESENSILRLLKYNRIDKYSVVLVFNKGVNNLQLNEAQNTIPWRGIQEWSLNRDSLLLFIQDTTEESIHIAMNNGESYYDTVQVKLNSSSTTKSESYNNKLQVYVKQFPSSSDSTLQLKFEANHPIENISGGLVIYKDSTGIDTVKLTNAIVDGRRFTVSYKWLPHSTYKIKLLPNIVTDIYGLNNDTLIKAFSLLDEKQTGVLVVKLNSDRINNDFLLQLVNEKMEILRQYDLSNETIYKFTYLLPGSYKLRVVHDLNHDKKWTIGNYGLGIQPEPVMVSGSLLVRANWELETDITTP
jgi:uncharacterized protein (DUF2141 family)